MISEAADWEEFLWKGRNKTDWSIRK